MNSTETDKDTMDNKPSVRQAFLPTINVPWRPQLPPEVSIKQEPKTQTESHPKMDVSGPNLPQGQGVKPQGHMVKVRPGHGHHGGVIGSDKYRLKYIKLKRFIKPMVFLNGALCDEVARADEAIAKVREQRRFLLRKLLQNQAVTEALNQTNSKQIASTMPQTPPSAGSTQHAFPSTAAEVKLEGDKLKPKKKTAAGPKRKFAKEAAAVLTSGEVPKMKTKKTGKGGVGKRLVLPIPLDNTGRPIFPIELGPLTIHSLGEITCDHPEYHSHDHIYPVGFCSTRPYTSLRNPTQRCLYTCKILDSGLGPKFEISPEDAPGHVISCHTADECHANLLSLINSSKGVEIVNPEPRGAEFFGFCHPTVQNLIQSCPGARKCANYKWVRFEVCRTDPGEAAAFYDDDPSINFDALQRSQLFNQGMERHKLLQHQVAAALEPTSSLRSLLTSGPLIQSTDMMTVIQGPQ